MKGFMKKILSAGLAFAMVFTMCPVLAYADTPQETQEKTAETDEPKAETTEVKAESADEKNTVLVYGRIEGSQHWTKDNIYYIITDSNLFNPVIIGDLTIDPGTTICFGQGNTSHGKIDQTDVNLHQLLGFCMVLLLQRERQKNRSFLKMIQMMRIGQGLYLIHR